MKDYYAMLRVVRTIAERENLRIEYIDAEACPYTDKRTLYVPSPDPTWSEFQWMEWLDGLFHETGHNMPENIDAFDCVIKNKIDMRSIFGKSFNIIDDYRVDRNRCRKYFGMREAIDVAMPYLVQKQAERPFPFGKGTPEQEKGMEIIWTLKAFDLLCRGVESAPLRGMEALFENHFTPNCRKWYDKLCSEYIEKYTNNITAEDELATLRDIFTNVFEFSPEESNQGEDEEESEGGECGEGEGEEESEGDKSEAEGEGEPSEEEGKKKKTKRIVVNYDDMLRHPTAKDGLSTSGEIKIVYDEHRTHGYYLPHNDSTSKTIDFTRGDRKSRGYTPIHEEDVQSMLAGLNISSITGQARRLLLAETRKRPHFNQKKGRLDTSKIFRVTLPESSSSERIFKTKETSQALDTAVTLLVDYSGSMMASSKICVAISAAVAFNNLLTTLRVNTEVLGFTETFSDNTNINYVFKPFGKTVNQDRMVEYMVQATSEMCNNADGDSILVAHSRIMQQKNPRKIIIVLSDGSPAASRGDVDGFTQKVIKNIEKSRDVDIIGIGILDDNVERLYKHNKVVYNLDRLPEVLIQTLESVILEK